MPEGIANPIGWGLDPRCTLDRAPPGRAVVMVEMAGAAPASRLAY